MSFLKSAVARLVGLFVADWLQSAIIVLILAGGWLAISQLRSAAPVVLVVLVLLLAGQLVWFVSAEARRLARA